MKKITQWITVSLLLAFASASQAYVFEDMIDDWGPGNVDAAFIDTNHPLSYQHNILDDGFTVGDQIMDVTLELDFTNDLGDLVWFFGWRTCRVCEEHVTALYDGSNWVVGEVDNGQYSLALDVSLLSDGLLDVTLSVVNGNGGYQFASLDHSRLYGNAEAVPAPAPLALMSLGLLGLGVFSRKLKS